MTLLKRLQPKFKKKLNLIKEKNPYTYANIINILQDHEFYSDLKINDAVTICFYLDVEFTIRNINDLFNE
jgi:hypothetical protein